MLKLLPLRRKKLIWQLYPAFLLIVLLSLAASGWYVSRTLKDFYLEETLENLSARSLLIEDAVAPLMAQGRAEAIQAFAQRLGHETQTRITIVREDGKVLGDSKENPERMGVHADRPEIKKALEGAVGHAMRYSHTLQQSMVYVAVPVWNDGEIIGSVRTSLSARSIEKTLAGIRWQLTLGGIAVALLAALVSLSISRRISRPLVEMKRGAERFAQGELDRRLPVSDSVEIGGLAEAMNQMASQLDDRIKTVMRQRNEQEAMLRSMVEGVVAVDTEERIIRINSAAGTLLGVEPLRAEGRMIHEVVRKADLQHFISRALSSQEPVEGDIVLYGNEGDQFLQAHGSLLRDSTGKNIGALVVLNDVTRLRRLENIRRDFVANVSHELKTPITAIKGFVETLLDGALEKKEDAQRFLDIILRQSERLHAIIEDLLALSRIEQESEKDGIELKEMPLKSVILSAIQACEPAASSKSISIRMFCENHITAAVNAPLLEQALVNLIENAVKYSPFGKDVLVDAIAEDGSILIRVKDNGPGISREHLPRLFERFYRVDKARSRKEGGTGLGLAIVKHIVQAHDGQVRVESVPGTGSTFSVRLPSPGR